MVMPSCGTFCYSGVVPDSKAALASGDWTLRDQSGAALRAFTSELRSNRLDRARAYLDVVRGDGEELRLAGREWTCLDTGKTSKPLLAYITLLFR